ncbi:hypothetical protein GH733_012071, partial [Mirounga leonina]
MPPLASGRFGRAVLLRTRSARLLGHHGASGGPGCKWNPPVGAEELRGELDRFGGVSVRLARLGALDRLDAASFQRGLQGNRFIAPAASLGFCFHHAESDSSTLTLWLGEGPSRLPGYATHQVGVA